MEKEEGKLTEETACPGVSTSRIGSRLGCCRMMRSRESCAGSECCGSWKLRMLMEEDVAVVKMERLWGRV